METENLARLATLSHPQRIAVVRLLMRRYPNELPAGEIAEVLGLKASTASTYLAALLDHGLAAQRRRGTSLLYRVDMANIRALFSFLFTDCCGGRPELCPPELTQLVTGAEPMSKRTYNVLFICVGNSARSIFAEALLQHAGGDRFNAFSAGTQAKSELNPFALEMLEHKGHDIAGLRAKTVAEFQGADAPELDFVFTVCDLAANEDCPPWKGQALSAHWSTPDPVKAEGTDAQKRLAFQQAYGMLKHRIEAFAALPFETLDQISLQGEMDRIGAETYEEKA